MENSVLKRIFISGINTQLGYHLTQTLRQDHKYLQNYPLISGTLSNESQQFMLHDSIHKTYNFYKQRDLTVKNAIESDVLIFDIRFTPSVQVQFILKVLKHYNLKKCITVIGISNYMTWSNCKTAQFSTAPIDKQTLLQYSLNKQHWKKHLLSPQNYKRRVPHPMYAYIHQLQQIIMNLKHHNKFISSRIVCTGVLCGKSGFDLKEYIKNAIDCNSKNSFPLFEFLKQKANNQNYKIPFLHIDQLLSEVQTVVQACLQKKQTFDRVAYKVLSSYQSQNIFRIIDQIYKLAGNYSLIDNNKQQQRLNERQQSRQTISKQPHSRAISDKSQGSNLLHIPQVGDQIRPSSRIASNNNLSILTSPSNMNFAAPILQILCKSNKTLLSLMIGNISFKQTLRSQQQRQQGTALNQVQISQRIYRQFLQCYQVEFKHLLISEETLHQIGEQKNKQLDQKLINKYYLLDKHQLCKILQQLIKQGTLISQRAPTPQQQKKKNPGKKNDTREQLKKEQYELFFAQLLMHFFKNNKNKNYIICLKKELIQRLLMLLRQQEFAQFHQLKFTLLCLPNSKQSSSQQYLHKLQQRSSVSIQKTIQFFSKQYNSQFQILTVDSSSTSIRQIQHFPQTPQYHVNVTKQIKKRINNGNKNDQQQIKINLISQYLLDNLVIYAAQAKQQLKLKEKLNIGQKFEGKQNIKLFIQELKRIRQRQTILANQQQEEENIC